MICQRNVKDIVLMTHEVFYKNKIATLIAVGSGKNAMTFTILPQIMELSIYVLKHSFEFCEHAMILFVINVYILCKIVSCLRVK